MSLSVRTLQSLKAGEWASDKGRYGAGRLAARRLNGGEIAFYFRYTKPDGKRDAIPLGLFSARKASGLLTLEQATNEAGALSERYRGGDYDLRAALDAEARQREAQRKEEEKQIERDAQRATLGDVLEGYCDHLDAMGKASADKVRGTLYRHVREASPRTWNEKAADIEIDDLIPIIAVVADSGKAREAEKLRSYIRSAFTTAIKARQSPGALPALRALNIRNNPSTDIAAIESASEGGERNLTLSELQAYWRRIKALPAPSGALLRFHLLTGAQRVTQLSRLTTEHFDTDSKTITIRDRKGRRQKARLHYVPLLPQAVEALEEMNGGSMGPHIFTLTLGETGASYDMARKQLSAVCSAMLEADELEHGAFTLGDIRRTVETRLAAAGVAPHIRAQLQSHGLSGVQTKHYDRHDYMPEKRRSLETLYRLITGDSGEVIQAKFG